ncbi:hypothetical protein ACFWN5_19110 [Streptomyces sp. NPDC058430]|uniref:hypothetical protein n=1 Tax=Streptomyces sp. NPDC058430 TaxID=3346495 RepID=UPI00365C011A
MGEDVKRSGRSPAYGLLAGFAGSPIGRLVWTAWGAASAAAIWVTVPDHQRTLSVAIAALAWGLASLFALRGLRLVPSIHIFNAAPTIKPELHLPHQQDHGLDDVADAVQRRPRPVPDRPPRSTSQALDAPVRRGPHRPAGLTRHNSCPRAEESTLGAAAEGHGRVDRTPATLTDSASPRSWSQ